MQANNILSIPRLGLLFRQGFIHNFRMIGMSLIAFSGGLFLLLLTVQLVGGATDMSPDSFSSVFLFIVIPLAIVYTGTAFPGFRSKEKSYSYLLTPASTFEKFVFEFFNRVFLFVIVIPLLYWVVVNIEGRFATVVMSRYTYVPNKMTDFLHVVRDGPELSEWAYALTIFSLLIFTIPFAGAASFTKLALLKTLFILAVMFFFNFFIAYLFVEVVGNNHYELPEDKKSILLISTEEGALRALAAYGVIINVGLLIATYFKLREKEV